MIGPIETLLWMLAAVVKFVLTPSLMIGWGVNWGNDGCHVLGGCRFWCLRIFSISVNGFSLSGVATRKRVKRNALYSLPADGDGFGFKDVLDCGVCLRYPG